MTSQRIPLTSETPEAPGLGETTRSSDRGCGNTVSAVGGVAHGLDIPSDRLAALSSEHLAVVPTETIGHDHGMEHESARAYARASPRFGGGS